MADHLALTNQTPRLQPGPFAYARPEQPTAEPESLRLTMARDLYLKRPPVAPDPASSPSNAIPLSGQLTITDKFAPGKSATELQYTQDEFSFTAARSKVVEEGPNGPLTTRGNAGKLAFGSAEGTLISLEGVQETNAEKQRTAGKIDFQEKDGLSLSAAAEQIRHADGKTPTQAVNLAVLAPTKDGKLGFELKDKVDATGTDAAVGFSHERENGQSLKIAAGQTTFKDGTAPTTNLSFSSITPTKDGKLGVEAKSKVDATGEDAAVGINLEKENGRSYKLIAAQTTFNDGKTPTTNVEFSAIAPTNSGKLGFEAKSKVEASGTDAAVGFSVEKADGKSVKIAAGQTTFKDGTAPTTTASLSTMTPVTKGKLSLEAKSKIDATSEDAAVGLTYERDNGRTLKVTAGQTTFNDGTAPTVAGDAVLTIPTHEGMGKVEVKLRGKAHATGNEVAAKLTVERQGASLELGASRTVANQMLQAETDLFKMTASPLIAMDAKLTVPVAEGKLSLEARVDQGSYQKTTMAVQYEENGTTVGVKGAYSPNVADPATTVGSVSTQALPYKGWEVTAQIEAGSVRTPQGAWEPTASGTVTARVGQLGGEAYVKADAANPGICVGYRMNF